MNGAAEEGDRLAGAPHPREAKALVGHAEAEAAVLSAWAKGRLPHAVLIGGPPGIGKATLAYRIARFVLANPRGDAKSANSLDVVPDHPVSRQVGALSHPDLLVLRRIAGEEGKNLPSVIPVDEVRRTVPFFGSTAALGGYRVAIVDSADELNVNGANALLKVLEEPPPHSLLLIVSHAPGRLLATIRSRCRRLMLRPLSVAEVARAVENLADAIPDLPRSQIKEAAAASGGSVRRALELLLGEGLEVRSLTADLLARLPAVDGDALHALGDRIQRDQGLSVFAETVEDWLAAAATETAAPPARLARLAETWEKVRRAAVEAEIYHLDRKPLVFQVFSMLAEATR
ncbi:MAG: DNA polymerase III subunit delta' [Xanthobacteraceae bacterium]|nr:DNA polymerase III subunit delta' [Xanthobacteraceae bacterium]